MLPVIAGSNIAVTRVPVPEQTEIKERRNVHSGPTSLNRATINELLLTLPVYRAASRSSFSLPDKGTGSRRPFLNGRFCVTAVISCRD